MINPKWLDLRQRMIEHRQADKLTQGDWWNGRTGCFYGCATHAEENTLAVAINMYDLPDWFVHWSEKVFEGLPKKQALEWPVQALDALINCKCGIDEIPHKLAIKRLGNLLPTDNEQVDQAIEQVIECHKNPDQADWSDAYWSAEYSARSARSAARSARSAARSAEYSTISAASSAEYSARSAEYSARSVVWLTWQNERDWFLEACSDE